MIARISGKVTEKKGNCLLIDVGGLSYEVMVPTAVMERIEQNHIPENNISLITYHYHQLEPSRSFPVLIGFLNEVEKEFLKLLSLSPVSARAQRLRRLISRFL